MVLDSTVCQSPVPVVSGNNVRLAVLAVTLDDWALADPIATGNARVTAMMLPMRLLSTKDFLMIDPPRRFSILGFLPSAFVDEYPVSFRNDPWRSTSFLWLGSLDSSCLAGRLWASRVYISKCSAERSREAQRERWDRESDELTR